MKCPHAKSALSLALSLAPWLLPSPVLAQSAELEEVVVTAQKREESLQDTPISLVALGSVQLENLGINDIADLGSNIPNLQVSPHPNSAATPRVFIRGIGNFDDQITQDPSVAIYMDGVYVGRNQGMGMEVADMERIEVLRGPQGILYGRNATGGAINFITRAPELDAVHFSQKLTVGNRSDLRSRTMLNVPISDTLAARVFYLKSQKDGFVRNEGRGEDNYGSQDHDAQRIDLLFQPNEQFDARYAYDRSHMEDTGDYISPATPGVAPQRPRRSHAGNQLIRPSDATTSGHQLTLNWHVGEDLTVRSITAYRDVDSTVFQDYLTGTGRPNTPLMSQATVDQNQWSQELQLLGNAFDNQLEYTLGAYYFEEEGDGWLTSGLPAFGIFQQSYAEVKNKAAALFGQATWTPAALDERLHVTLGARTSKDERDADLLRFNQLLSLATPGDVASGVPGAILPASVVRGSGNKDFDNISPALTLAYDVTDEANVYVKVADGYKSGGFNIRATTMPFFENGFDEETLRSYEAGLKSQWLDNRLRLNMALFRAEYDDIQINVQTDANNPSRTDVLNGGKATIEGAELELTAVLTETLQFALQYGYLDAGYDEVIDGRGVDVTRNFAFVNAPEHSVTADLTWDVAQTPVGLLVVNVNYTWQDEKEATIAVPVVHYIIDDYGLLNARVSLQDIPGLPKGSLDAALWARNITDEEYPYIYGAGFGTNRVWGEPLSYGLDLTYRF